MAKFEIGTLVKGSDNYYLTNENSIGIVLSNPKPRIGGNDTIIVGLLECSSVLATRLRTFTDDTIAKFLENVFNRDYVEYGVLPVQEKDMTAITPAEWEAYKREKERKFYSSPNKERLLSLFLTETGKITWADAPKEAPAIIHYSLYDYKFSEKQKEDFLKKGKKLLDTYDHKNSKKGLLKIWNEYVTNKAWIAGLLSKCPFWDDNKLAIVFPSNYERTRDAETINSFATWLQDQIIQLARENQYTPNMMTYNEMHESINYLNGIIRYMKQLAKIQKSIGGTCLTTNYTHNVVFDGKTIAEYQEEYNRLLEIRKIFDENAYNFYGYQIHKDFYRKLNNAFNFANTIRATELTVADKDFAGIANCYAIPFNREKNGKVIGLGAVEGQKISRIVGKFYKNLNMDKIIDIHEETFLDANGNEHTRRRDYGWNGKFCEFCDAINPLKVKKWTVISINPIDYLTMSFGNTWNSCQTIDKTNKRKKGSDDYHGMYCSGTLSYLLDSASIIMYIIDSAFKGEDFCLEDKESRCMFWIGEDKLIQGRVYPDGRNAGKETSIAGQMRTIMQKTIADCVGTENMWAISKGTDACDKVTKSYGTHYRDYLHYEDCNVSYLKRNGVIKNINLIEIGHNPICPNCGDEHIAQGSLACGDCRTQIVCHECGEVISIDEAIYDTDTGNYYCDYECAERNGCYYCENVGEWHSNEEWIYCDDYSDITFWDYNQDDCIHFYYEEHGCDYHFIDDYNANRAGFYNINGNWYFETDKRIMICPHCGKHILKEYVERNGYCHECGTVFESELNEAV